MQKKGQVLLYGLITGLIAAIIISYVSGVQTKRDFPVIGQSSLKIIEASKEAEKVLFYIDQSAKYSAQQAIYDLAQKGGCKNSERYFGYSIWRINGNDPESICPQSRETINQNFMDLSSKNLNDFLQSYEPITLSLNNFNLDFKDNFFLGISINPLKIPIIDEESEQLGEYSIKPSFKVNLEYDFSDYDELRKRVEDVTENCQDLNEIRTCAKRYIEGEKEEKEILFDFELLETCETDEEETFLKFVEYFESCEALQQTSCSCLGKPEEGSFEITKSDNGVIIRGEINDKKYSREIEKIEIQDNLEDIEGSRILHKDTKGNLIVERDFKIIGRGKTGPFKPACNLEPQTKIRFCVESNNNKFYAYDKDDKKVALRNVVYKFALDFGENLKSQTTEQIDEGQLSDLVPIDRGLIACDGTCQLQYEVYEQLKLANQIAREDGSGIYVYSSNRDLGTQIALWEGNTDENYKERYPNEKERRKYVCYPYGDDVYERCPHLTGKAVDVRIEGNSRNEQMSDKDWEKLAKIMYDAGWVRYKPELWHFEYGTERWARAQEVGVNAIV